MNYYDRGDKVRITGTFKDANSAAADPTTITLKVHRPDGTLTTYTYGTDAAVVRSGVGVYYADLSLTAAGRWIYRWEGAGAVEQAVEGYLYVNSTVF